MLPSSIDEVISFQANNIWTFLSRGFKSAVLHKMTKKAKNVLATIGQYT